MPVFQGVSDYVAIIRATTADPDGNLNVSKFRPAVANNLALMNRAIFLPEPMGLREELLQLPLAQRFDYDAAQDIFFANFEGLTVCNAADVQLIRAALEERLAPLAR